MQDGSASICVTKIITKTFYGGLSPAYSCWGPDDKKNASGRWLIEFYSYQLLSSVLSGGHIAKATLILPSARSSLDLEQSGHLDCFEGRNTHQLSFHIPLPRAGVPIPCHQPSAKHRVHWPVLAATPDGVTRCYGTLEGHVSAQTKGID